MSSCWAAYHGLALVLNTSEFRGFLKCYMEKRPLDNTTKKLKDLIEEECGCGFTADRDYNAAVNIKNEGLKVLMSA